VSPGGFEPPTNSLKGYCSAVELWARGDYILLKKLEFLKPGLDIDYIEPTYYTIKR
jgi:hypothetical protein